MQKLIFLLFTFFSATYLQAQIANSKWNATLEINGSVNAIIDFKKDTVSVYTVADSTVIETMTFTAAGNDFTLVKVSGQSDCDNSPAKYSYKIENGILAITPVSDNCPDRSGVLESVKWKRWNIPAEVSVDAAVLKQYTGMYKSDDYHVVTLSMEAGKLYIEGPGINLPKSVLMPESNSKFFLRLTGKEIDFVKDASGKVTKLISHEDTDVELKKVK